MTDRELLEAAAKAAGLRIYFDDVGQCCKHQPCDQLSTWLWNPLTDDGDALRLAVKLRLVVQHEPRYVVAIFLTRTLDISVHEDNGIDPDAATRRAIVRAAAEVQP